MHFAPSLCYNPRITRQTGGFGIKEDIWEQRRKKRKDLQASITDLLKDRDDRLGQLAARMEKMRERLGAVYGGNNVIVPIDTSLVPDIQEKPTHSIAEGFLFKDFDRNNDNLRIMHSVKESPIGNDKYTEQIQVDVTEGEIIKRRVIIVESTDKSVRVSATVSEDQRFENMDVFLGELNKQSWGLDHFSQLRAAFDVITLVSELENNEIQRIHRVMVPERLKPLSD